VNDLIVPLGCLMSYSRSKFGVLAVQILYRHHQVPRNALQTPEDESWIAIVYCGYGALIKRKGNFFANNSYLKKSLDSVSGKEFVL